MIASPSTPLLFVNNKNVCIHPLACALHLGSVYRVCLYEQQQQQKESHISSEYIQWTGME